MLGTQILPLVNLHDSGSDYHHDVIDTSESSLVPNDALEEDISLTSGHDISENTIQNSQVEQSTVETGKIRFSAKRKGPQNVSKADAIGGYVQAKKMRLNDRSKIEDELVTLKREHFLKQNKLLDEQLETAKLQTEAAQLEIIIKKTQVKYEEVRLQQITGVFSFAA